MGLNDACITGGAVALGCRGGKIGRRACGKLTAFRVLAFGEPLFSYLCKSERPCRDSDAQGAAPGVAPGRVTSRSSWGNPSSVL